MSYLLWTRTQTRICHVYIVRRMRISHTAWVDHVVGQRSQTEIQGVVVECIVYNTMHVMCAIFFMFLFALHVMCSGIVFVTMCFHNSIIQSQSERNPLGYMSVRVHVDSPLKLMKVVSLEGKVKGKSQRRELRQYVTI